MLSRIDRRSRVFVRRLREALRASLRAKIVALAGVVDLRGGLGRIDAHSTDWIFGQFRFPSLVCLATRNYFVTLRGAALGSRCYRRCV